MLLRRVRTDMSQVEMKCLKSGALHSQFPDWSYVIYMTGAEERHGLDTGCFFLRERKTDGMTKCPLFKLFKSLNLCSCVWQNLRICTRESWRWKIWFATVSKLQREWSSWRHARYCFQSLRNSKDLHSLNCCFFYYNCYCPSMVWAFLYASHMLLCTYQSHFRGWNASGADLAA